MKCWECYDLGIHGKLLMRQKWVVTLCGQRGFEKSVYTCGIQQSWGRFRHYQLWPPLLVTSRSTNFFDHRVTSSNVSGQGFRCILF